MRTKLPKLIAKTMSRSTRTDNDDSSGTCRKKKKKKKKISTGISSKAKNVCSILLNALTTKKSSSSSYSSSSEGDDRVCSINTHECKECSVEREEKRNGRCSLIIEREQQNVCRANEKPPTKVSLPFSGFLSKKLNKATSGNLTRVSSMGFKSFGRTRTWKETVKITQDETEATDERREELCKKRILMGGKCRPLHASGALHYDNNGILLPEEILSCDDEDYYLV